MIYQEVTNIYIYLIVKKCTFTFFPHVTFSGVRKQQWPDLSMNLLLIDSYTTLFVTC